MTLSNLRDDLELERGNSKEFDRPAADWQLRPEFESESEEFDPLERDDFSVSRFGIPLCFET